MSLGSFFRDLRKCAFDKGLLSYAHLFQLDFDINYIRRLEDGTLAEPRMRDLNILASLYADALNLPRRIVREAVYTAYCKEFTPSRVQQ